MRQRSVLIYVTFEQSTAEKVYCAGTSADINKVPQSAQTDFLDKNWEKSFPAKTYNKIYIS